MALADTTLIHHYTEIETLALILEHRTVRFSRLDKVDDVSESKLFGQINLAQFLFVNCWTYEGRESIPQWHMYTREMRGVRISMPRRFFHYQPMILDPDLGIQTIGSALVPIESHRIFSDDYCILPPFLVRNEFFEKEVEYLDDLQSVYDGVVAISAGANDPSINISRLQDLAKYKSSDWRFQNELRYVLLAFPSLKIPPGGFNNDEWSQRFSSQVVSSLLNGRGPNMDYIDLPVDPLRLDSIIVTTGPRASHGDKLIVGALVDKYSKNGIVRSSSLEGSIR